MTTSPPPGFPVVLRGYDRAQVDAHLARLQQQLEAAQERAAEARRQLSDRPSSRVDQPAPLGSALFRRLEEEAHELRRQAALDADRIRAEAVAQAREIQAQAEERAQASADHARAELAALRGEHEALVAERDRLAGERDHVRARAAAEAQDLLRRAAERAQQHADAVVEAAETEARAVLQQAAEQSRQTADEARVVEQRLSSTNGAVARLVTALEHALGATPATAPPAAGAASGAPSTSVSTLPSAGADERTRQIDVRESTPTTDQGGAERPSSSAGTAR